ncbi:MAG: alpha/beta hydrolase [Kiritimatiellae bacterium]|nr:alpha/beta hydrolase [Kiritimatiellia bacterium]MDD5521659.1 alpha/beta hydrolase [Kiritimatiellia bacterium]
MKTNFPLTLAVIFWFIFSSQSAFSADTSGKPAFDLWPGMAPGQTNMLEGTENPSKDTIIRLGNVTKPNLTLYKVDKSEGPAPAVVVCPGGGYSILAMNLEGTEIAEWLNSIGITAILLKYRVPNNRQGAFQDVQRAFRVARQNAKVWNIDPERIGIIGFSAGGHLSARACNGFETKSYDPVDKADEFSCRPDFAMLIYPAYLTTKDFTIVEELPVTSKTPSTILIQTQDDGIKVENSIYYYLALKQAKVASELHIFPTGGHGYGLRPSKNAVSNWPKLCETWLEKTGVLKK